MNMFKSRKGISFLNSGESLSDYTMNSNQQKKEHNHKWVLTYKSNDYTQGALGKQKYCDYEFVCPKCETVKRFTKKVSEWQ